MMASDEPRAVPQRRRQLAGPTPYRLSCLSLRFSLLEPVAALTAITAHLSAHRALTDAQNAGDAFSAGPALAQRINLTAILVCYPPVLPHRQPLAMSRGYPLSLHSIMRWIVESATYFAWFNRRYWQRQTHLAALDLENYILLAADFSSASGISDRSSVPADRGECGSDDS